MIENYILTNIFLKKFITYFLVLLGTCQLLFSQSYTVSNHQKINEANGSFLGDLDDQDFFGISIDQIGDLDGNGINDIAVGAYADDDGGFNKGAVWILFMDANDQVISHTKISNTSGGFNGVLDQDDRFGGAVAYLGDMNNDGLVELAVGADYDGDGGFWHGAVWILSLNSDGTVNSHSKISDTQGGFTGFINGDAIFGTDIENIGDLNGDGIEDLAVGSRRDGDGGPRRGTVWILFMNSDFTVNSYQQISDTQGNFTAPLEFEDYFGGSVANIGDLNGDGVVDLAVGAYRDDDLNMNSGCFYVLFLNADGTVNNYQKISNFSAGLSNQISSDALFAESIDGSLDIDNDGKIEIVVGAMRQINTTLQMPTGGFYILELNPDGTLSEQHFYSYAENCFDGTLVSGDLFGGSVSILNDDPGNLKIVAGAYSDSETGFRKGAAWILNFGQIAFNLEMLNQPSGCGIDDGSFTVSGLSSNTIYNITYDDGTPQSITLTSNQNGLLTVSGLSPGMYTNIEITQSITGCSATLEDIELFGNFLGASFEFNSSPDCNSTDGSMLFSNLDINTSYTISYNFEGNVETLNLTSDGIGEIFIAGLMSGIYSNITITDDATQCSDNYNDIEILQGELNGSINFTNSSTCGVNDGTISITDLNPNSEYLIDFQFESNPETLSMVSDGNGEIVISNLAEGNYTSIIITEISTNCSDQLSDVLITSNSSALTFTIDEFPDCGDQNGVISIFGLNNSSLYVLDFQLNNENQSIEVLSNQFGVIQLNNLSSGVYSLLTITESNSGCLASLEDFELATINFDPIIDSNNPSYCDSEDGSITFTNLVAGNSYTISFNNGILQQFTSIASDSGVINILNLSAGTYLDIIIIDELNECQVEFSDIELECFESFECFRVKNFFTPNGDGINDFWFLDSFSEDCSYTVTIFDRFGKLIKVLTPDRFRWDGTYNGADMPSTDYWYVVDYLNSEGQQLQYTSHFSLKR